MPVRRHRCANDGAAYTGSSLRDAELAWVASAMRAVGQRACTAGLQRIACSPFTVALAACVTRALADSSDQVGHP